MRSGPYGADGAFAFTSNRLDAIQPDPPSIWKSCTLNAKRISSRSVMSVRTKRSGVLAPPAVRSPVRGLIDAMSNRSGVCANAAGVTHATIATTHTKRMSVRRRKWRDTCRSKRIGPTLSIPIHRMTSSDISRYLCALFLILNVSSIARAQQPPVPDRRTIPAARLRVEERITLDGRLDEPVWTRAIPAANFVQIDPDNGVPATEPTEVRIAFDGNALYMGVTCFDSEPDRWLGYETRRDQFLASDDRFMWTIDTFLDARSGYFFEMNPSGLMADSLFGVNGDNRAWDGIWNARVRRSEVGWTIEIEIPFRTVNFDPDSDTWGINFQRTVRRKNEDSIWTGWARNQGLRRMTNAGHVTGIRNVTQGRGLDIKPYGLFTSQASPGRGNGSFDGNATAGLDLFYNPTPLVRANLTVNTDFAQTEVDQRQVNLTRYSLFFPEKRDFFLDGSIFFDFGSPTNADLRINPFFSRRIGLSSAGTPQKIDFGTKVTGQMGGQDVGLLHVRTSEDGDLFGEDFTVARVKRRLFAQSYIGAMYTRRDARADGLDARQTAGVDASF